MIKVRAKCPKCGAIRIVDKAREIAICGNCGNPYIVKKAVAAYTRTNSVSLGELSRMSRAANKISDRKRYPELSEYLYEVAKKEVERFIVSCRDSASQGEYSCTQILKNPHLYDEWLKFEDTSKVDCIDKRYVYIEWSDERELSVYNNHHPKIREMNSFIAALEKMLQRAGFSAVQVKSLKDQVPATAYVTYHHLCSLITSKETIKIPTWNIQITAQWK